MHEDLVLSKVMTLPKGSVVQFTNENLDRPEYIPYDPAHFYQSQHGFVRDIKVLSIPGRSQRFVDAINKKTLYLAKVYLKNASRNRAQLKQRAPVYKADLAVDPNKFGKALVGQITEQLEIIPRPSEVCSRCGIQDPRIPEPQVPRLLTTQVQQILAHLNKPPELDDTALENALANYFKFKDEPCVKNKPCLENERYLAVMDYTQPSDQKRLYIFDLETGLYRQELAAHGIGSGNRYAKDFSNVRNSHQSSLGAFITDQGPYQGKHGKSLRLNGMEESNDAARRRAIVIHGSKYVNERIVRETGRIGRSWGCPAVDRKISSQLIDTLKGGTLFYAYGGSDSVT